MEEIRDPQAVLDALERAKNDAKRYREEAESLTQQLADQAQALADQRADLEAQIATAKDEASSWKSSVKRGMVESAVRDVKGNERVLRFIDMDSIDIEDNKLVGFDEAIEKVREDLPELFDDKKRAGSVDLFAQGAPRLMSGSERQVARIFGS